MERDHATAHGYAVIGLPEQPRPSYTGQREVDGPHRHDATRACDGPVTAR